MIFLPQVNFSEISQMNNGLLRNINFWVFSVGLKIVPCILLTYLSLALIRVLLEAERRRQRLKSNTGAMASHISVASAEGGAVQAMVVMNAGTRQQQHRVNQGSEEERRGSNRSATSFLRDEDKIVAEQCTEQLLSPKQENNDKQGGGTSSSSVPLTPSCSSHTRGAKHHLHQQHHHPHVITSSSSQSDRTTKMLLAILLLYLVTEIPNGIITLFVGLLGESFHNNVYMPLGDIFDILALINSGINFILLASMSRLFRKTFCKIFWPRKYHNHYLREKNAQQTEKTNANHNTILRANATAATAATLNQSGIATTTTTTTTTTMTNKSTSPYSMEGTIEPNRLPATNCDTAIITVTEPSHQDDQMDDNNETTMV